MALGEFLRARRAELDPQRDKGLPPVPRGRAPGLDDPRVEAFLARIRAHSPEAWRLWCRREVSDVSSRIRVLRHPELGVRRFRIHVLTVGGADRVAVVLHTPG